MLNADLTRAARALLGWTQEELALKSKPRPIHDQRFRGRAPQPRKEQSRGDPNRTRNRRGPFPGRPSQRPGLRRTAQGDIGAIVADLGWPAGARRV